MGRPDQLFSFHIVKIRLNVRNSDIGCITIISKNNAVISSPAIINIRNSLVNILIHNNYINFLKNTYLCFNVDRKLFSSFLVSGDIFRNLTAILIYSESADFSAA